MGLSLSLWVQQEGLDPCPLRKRVRYFDLEKIEQDKEMLCDSEMEVRNNISHDPREDIYNNLDLEEALKTLSNRQRECFEPAACASTFQPGSDSGRVLHTLRRCRGRVFGPSGRRCRPRADGDRNCRSILGSRPTRSCNDEGSREIHRHRSHSQRTLGR